MTPETENTNQNDIYRDPKLDESKANDPIYELIKDNWKSFLTTVVSVLVVIYFIQTFQESYQASMQASADIFHRLQINYKEFSNLQDELRDAEEAAANDKSKQEANKPDSDKTDSRKKIDDINKKITETKSQIEQLINSASDSREPYKNFTQLYKALLNKDSNPSLAKEILSQYSDWKNTGKPESEERMVAELGALSLAKVLLASGIAGGEKGKDFTDGVNLIKDLTTSATFVNVAAAKVLSSYATSDAEKTQAKEAIKELIINNPGQSDLLKDLELNKAK